MAKLTTEQKHFVVHRLAAFRTPTEICREIKERWNVEATPQQIQYYDPTVPSTDTSEKWTEIFHAARQSYLDSEGEVAIGHLRWRLEQLERIYRLAVKEGAEQAAAALKALEQAALEMGGKFTNRSKLDVEHGGSLAGVLMVGTPEADTETWEEHARRQQEALSASARESARAAAGGG